MVLVLQLDKNGKIVKKEVKAKEYFIKLLKKFIRRGHLSDSFILETGSIIDALIHTNDPKLSLELQKQLIKALS